jgi:hypothetical protein
MRKLILGIAAAATMALSGLAFTPAPAQALDFSITFGTAHPPIVRHHHYDPRPVKPAPRVAPRHAPPPRVQHYRGKRYDDHRGWRDHRGHDRHWRDRRHVSRDCQIVTQRYWDGRNWVTDRRRVCRH